MNEVSIFTTNYDRVIDIIYENVLESQDWILLDGFEPYTKRSRRYFMLEKNISNINKEVKEPNLRLFQLHGSLRWKEVTTNDDRIIIEKLPIEIKNKTKTHDKPFLIYPGMIKTNNTFPFKQLYNYFKEYLNKTKHCIIIGCSFRDKTITDMFFDALKNNPSLKLTIMSGENTTDYLKESLKDYGIIKYITHKRINTIDKRFGEYDISKIL